MTKEEKLQAIHQNALSEFDNIQSAVSEERQQALSDRRFYSIAGAQWEGDLEAQFENKPRLEVNKVQLSIMRIVNEYRNNRITVDFVSKDGANADDLADTCDGLYRSDEQDSTAEEAYDNAFEEAVGGGYGAWRLRAEYEDEYDEDNEYQRIRIEPIYDADSSVYFDINAKRQDKADAKHCFVLTSMTPEAYEEQFGESPASWSKTITDAEFDWASPDAVYVAEYYVCEEAYETIRTFKTITGEEEKYTEKDFEDDNELEETLAAVGTVEVSSRKIKTKKVHKYIMSGSGILEDCGYIAGKNIPIIPVYGQRRFIDNVERAQGHVRLARDAQQLKNMQLSKLAEISAESSAEKPILLPEQIAGHEMMWTEDNIKNYPYLLINPIEDMNGNVTPAGPIAYTRAPQIPPALAALLQLTEQDMKEVLGNTQNQNNQIASNISGKAVELILGNMDMQTYIYMSNMAKAIKRSGQVWLSMAKDILIEDGRKMKIVGRQNNVSSVTLREPEIIEETGELSLKNDLRKANFDVAVEVGPSSSTKRQATIKNLTEMMRVVTDPNDLKVISSMIMMNMEGEGIGDVREYYRMQLVRQGVIKPNKEDMAILQQESQGQQPDAQTQYFLAEAEKSKSQAVKAQADTQLNIAKAEEVRASTIETLSRLDMDKQKQAIDTAIKMEEAMNKIPNQ